MEIILIDDGSDDNETINIINSIKGKYNNVKTYFFKDGASGSPARPRNKGIEFCTTDYISYLDPDNESINDGYAKLYNYIKDKSYDLIIGSIIFDNGKIRKKSNYYGEFLKSYDGLSESYNGREILIKTKFKSQSIQSIIVKKELIIKNKLKMVNGSLGEDTLFFYELVLNSNSTKVIKEVIHIYYNKEKGSLTNIINKSFFEKYFILEKSKIVILEKYKMLDLYLEKKYEFYFLMWYLEKLKNVEEEEKEECEIILYKIYNLYKDKWNIKDERLIKYLIIRNK